MITIQHTSPVPLYAQVKAILQGEIERALRPGDPLSPEPELEKRFGVSRITIRRALDELAAEGLIVRYQGRGTFVRERPITQELTELLSWTSAMRRLGYEPKTLSSEITEVESTGDLAARLHLTAGQTVIRIRRLRGAAAEPICLMINYVPSDLVPDLMVNGLSDDSVYATLLKYGMRPVRVEDTVEARAATETEAEELGVEPWSPLLHVTRVSYDAGNRPLDVAVVSSRADKYRYTVHYVAETNREPPLVARPEREGR